MKSKISKLAVLFVFIGVIAILALTQVERSASAIAADGEETIYKAKCAMCHGQRSEKSFNPEMTDEEMVKAILDGKKGEKPPFMPAFKEKGIDEEKAKALVAHMRKLRTPPSE
jgi:cytochrome c553